MFMLQYLQLLLKLLLHDILRMTTHIDFKYGSITFLKETKQLAKSQHLGIAPLWYLAVTKNVNTLLLLLWKKIEHTTFCCTTEWNTLVELYVYHLKDP